MNFLYQRIHVEIILLECNTKHYDGWAREREEKKKARERAI